MGFPVKDSFARTYKVNYVPLKLIMREFPGLSALVVADKALKSIGFVYKIMHEPKKHCTE